jgi:transposase
MDDNRIINSQQSKMTRTIMNDNPNTATSASQTKQILEYLQQGNTITPLEALRKFGCFRLTSRIWDIEQLTGIRPKRERVKVTNAQGQQVYVMQYWI